jgi:uracil-DNA glycosylase
MMAFEVPPAWQPILQAAISAPNAHTLAGLLAGQEVQGRALYPHRADHFKALELTHPDHVRVVILGQDPYHGEAQAHGLAFSVPVGIPIPPSLRNIFKELTRDLGAPAPAHGNLEHWASQGVLLLNTVLTVEEGNPGSHQGLGWEDITDTIIAHLGARETPTVFMLWGAHAQKKRSLISNKNHLVLEAPHPSPLSAHRGFLGCGHFGKANAFLVSRRVDW